MTPDERRLLADLFDRVRAAAGAERDREAEQYIDAQTRENPHSAYVLAQAVLLQEAALKQASERIEELEADLRDAQENADAAQDTPDGGGFLGGLGKSLFGGSERESRQGASPWGVTGSGVTGSGVPSTRRSASGITLPPPPAGIAAARGRGPGAAGRETGQELTGGGNSFLRGALGAAAGVAGGLLLGNALGGMLSGSGAKAAENRTSTATTPANANDDASSDANWREASWNEGDDWDNGDDWGDDDWGSD